MARLGCCCRCGSWAVRPILSDAAYYQAVDNPPRRTSTGPMAICVVERESSFMYQGIQFPFQGQLMTNAPIDVYAAMGKKDSSIN